MNGWIDLHDVLPGLRGDAVHAVDAAGERRLREALADAGFDVRVLEGARVVNEAAFFEELARALALPAHFGANWDALNDALGDLEGHVALVWRDADRTLACDAQTLLSAVQALSSAALEPAPDAGDTRPLQLEVFLLGAAPGFASLR
jgi:RNAse (barnase) inhibitor barstar